MGIPFDKDDKTGESPEAEVQTRIFIGGSEQKDSKTSGKPMIVLGCIVTENQQGEGYDCKYYLASGKMFNFNCKNIMLAVGIDIDAIDEVDDMTFRGFDAAVVFKEDTFNGRTKMIIDKWVPRSEATIELSPDPKPSSVPDSAPDVQDTRPDPEYADSLPF